MGPDFAHDSGDYWPAEAFSTPNLRLPFIKIDKTK